jgi:hypothetical protein
MNSPAASQRISDSDGGIARVRSDAAHSEGAPDRQRGSAEALRLAAAALQSQPGAASEAFAYFSAVYDKLSLQEEAMLAFGKLLVARTNDMAIVSEALNKLIQIQHANTVRVDQSATILGQMLQMSLRRSWSEDLDAPRYANPKRLLRYGFKVYSQGDEDGIIQEIFNRIGTTNCVFVEFGVESGIECNSVKLLVDGWRGLWIDGGANNVEQIKKRFAAFIDDRKLTVTEAFITAENINELIGQSGVRGEIDLLSFDIDNNDYWVWKAIEVIQPRVVVVEYNATLRPPLSLVVPYDAKQNWQGSNYFGASLEALVKLGRSKGYRIVGCSYSGANAFFVREDAAQDRFLDPATAEEHYEPPRYHFALLKAGHSAQPGPFVMV